jgi:hypothetical protein
MLTGRNPGGEDPYAVVLRHVNDPVPRFPGPLGVHRSLTDMQ